MESHPTAYDRGEKWWTSAGSGEPSLTAQLPLLDGAEGKSNDAGSIDNIRALSPDLPGKDARDARRLQPAMRASPPLASTRERGGGSRSPVLIDVGAVTHVSIAEAGNNALAFTPRSLLGRTNPPRAAPMPSATEEDHHNAKHKRPQHDGLEPPRLDITGACVTGADTPRHRIENKRRRRALLATQSPSTQWTRYKGEFELPPPLAKLESHRGGMCPDGLALHHPAAELLNEWASYGCPTRTGRPWKTTEMQEAVDRGPHRSAMSADAIAHFGAEVAEKVKSGQAKLVAWESIKDNPPPELKISPIAAIPHKSKQFRSILDLSFHLQLKLGGTLPSVNATTIKTAPRGAIDQLGHSLTRIIHAFAETKDEACIFMAKWDIKDGFWRLDAEDGAEWNFAYVLPQEPGKPIYLVVPTSLQMGWVESPPFFCAASETARDVAQEYCEAKVGTLPPHKFTNYVTGNQAYDELPEQDDSGNNFRYLLEVYVDDFVSLVIPTSREQLRHVSTGIMTGIHDVFPADDDDSNDPISEKKLKQGDGRYATKKIILGFEFDGVNKTLWLEEAKRAHLLTVLQGWIRSSKAGMMGIPFKEFESVIAKVRHAFTAIPAGRGLLTPCNKMLRTKPPLVFLKRNPILRAAVMGCRTLLRESSYSPTRCRELVGGWPDYIGVCDASSHGAGGVVFGENKVCVPTVFRWEWPPVIKELYHNDTITNSDLEMAGLLFLWLVMESVCGDLREQRVALFSDNSPTVGWVRRLATKGSMVSAHLIRALALRLKLNGTCPITPLHIAGEENSMTDIPSRSFGSEPKWFCKTNSDLLALHNTLFPLPQQNSWTVFQISYAVGMRVTSVLQTKDFTLDEWRRLPKVGKHVGGVGQPMLRLWEWTLSYRTPRSQSESASLKALPGASEQVTTVEANKSKLEAYLAQSRPLDRRSRWPQTPTLPR